MDETIDLHHLAFKSERAASRRLARTQGLSEEQALRRTLELNAGRAGLAALVASRTALRDGEEQRAAARDVARDAVRAAGAARREAARRLRHGEPPDGSDAATGLPVAAASGNGDAAIRPPTSAPTAGTTAWRAWFDGSARPNPGRCAIGAVLLGPDGRRVELAQDAGYGSSSDAEYRALIALLQAALAHGARALTVYGDSRVVIDDVNGPDALAARVLAGYRAQVRALAARFDPLYLRWVPRHRNTQADALAQQAGNRPAPAPTDTVHATDTDA
ncbi:ribonuclease HI family protein [Massilia forsythiae]|uniref:Ribonuclease HI family protein n=1 Tax=Massilia forsythiae TaxID=2728020 RepID=A0A7Z2W0X0_9BURK|nr:ribonuclease HI family protein [Massilia forsythiae]QJE02684.1 ribonuclease HI family protein [Massilia forsythiae]